MNRLYTTTIVAPDVITSSIIKTLFQAVRLMLCIDSQHSTIFSNDYYSLEKLNYYFL